ncbi:metal ABC transporter substrate-binding protein [Methylopila sp. M107]|uniref:metal ABC transporter substrate-binding protein n=1 Tax=Methylopila sp. M107 TaxID=1101190 RepID=UPI00036F06B3|nr:metal ABC transporter substrate-binding protein [Methylopila sp. M107]
MKLNRLVAAAFAAGLISSPAVAEPLKAVASFSILGDLVSQVGGDRVRVETLVGPNGDAHVFSPSPADARKVAEAKIVFENGLGLEGWMSKLAKSAGSGARVVVVSKGVSPIEMKDEDDHAHGSHGHGAVDPHAWQNVRNVVAYVKNIRDALVSADPDGAEAYEARTEAYVERLEALNAEIEEAWAKIPIDRRKIITSHDAFGYFAMAYGLEIIAPQGVSTESEASAKDVARIIRQIKNEKTPAVFIENISDKRLIERIARETGAKVGGALYSDALSPRDGPAATYIDMMRSNLRTLTQALTS